MMKPRGFRRTELPPHARRIRNLVPQSHDTVGTTSACAENTSKNRFPHTTAGNYLRMRGEYPRNDLLVDKEVGTTSACAENTYEPPLEPSGEPELPPHARRIPCRSSPPRPHLGNYLRMRGEYGDSDGDGEAVGELPPRARRIPAATQILGDTNGTTSACAENTHHS